jgi:hypothetical protein
MIDLNPLGLGGGSRAEGELMTSINLMDRDMALYGKETVQGVDIEPSLIPVLLHLQQELPAEVAAAYKSGHTPVLAPSHQSQKAYTNTQILTETIEAPDPRSTTPKLMRYVD